MRHHAKHNIVEPPPLSAARSSLAKLSSRPFDRIHQSTTLLSLSPSDLSRSYDSLLERLPSQNIISAVDQSSGRPITASDLSTTAGISLSQARKELTTLASLTRGDIAVSSDGELIYTFPSNVSSALTQSNAKYMAVKVWEDKIYPTGLYVTKLGFGLVLLASLVAIFSTIFFISTSGGGSSDRDDDDRRERRGGGGMMGMPGGGFGGFWGPSPFDFFYYRPYYSRYYYVDDGTARRSRNDDEMGFLESVFSYVFGDGNPNGDVEVRRLSLAADMIRKNGGAVSAEQLAPYCDDAPMPIMEEIIGGELGKERAYVDESFVLPIVAQLDGEPQVTEEGDIVYAFPELMTSASSSSSTSSSLTSKEATRMRRESKILRRAGLDDDAPTSTIKTLLSMNGISTRGALERADLIDVLERALSDEQEDVNEDIDADPSLLLEREFKFSLASPIQTILAGGLGVVNLGGALYLGNLLGQYASYGIRLPSYMGVIQQFYPLLLGYAFLFNAIPLLRNLWIQGQNAKIQRRNESRKSWKALLEKNAGSVKRKLAAAARFGRRMRQLGSESGDVIFTTTMDLKELEKTKERDMMKDFDTALKEKGGSSAWE